MEQGLTASFDGQPTTRLAPSPTGALHLGNARTFVITWALARKFGWRIVLRIEDFDTPRVKTGATEGIIETLRWLGLDWDPPAIGPDANPLVQTSDIEPYRAAIRRLADRGLAYPCELTRTQIEQAASAPQEGSHEIAFDVSLRPEIAGTCIDFDAAQAGSRRLNGEPTNWRFMCPDATVEFDDAIAGPQEHRPLESIGDFVLWTKRDQPSYQLAVVVDDHRQGVNQVVRGDDLLDSAARQLLLYRALGYALGTGGGEPRYWHLPLVIGMDGKRLAKRHGDTRIDEYRRRGVPPEAVIGLIAEWTIPGVERRPMVLEEFKERLDPATMPRNAITFTQKDDAWLVSHAR